MFGWFKKFGSKKLGEAGPVETDFMRALDMTTSAIHVVCGGRPLCGSNNAKAVLHPTTVVDVLDSVQYQHDGWYWCSGCASIFTGKPAAFFRDARQKNSH